MKWAALFLLMAAVFPLGIGLRRHPWIRLRIWTLVGFLPFVIYRFHLYMAIVSWTEWPLKNVTIAVTEWPGYVHGAEVSILDIVSLALYLSLPGNQRPLPFRISMALYFVAASVSTLQAEEPIAALFYLWQLARMFLVYATVTKACSDPRVALAILKGMAVGLFMEMTVEIWQRFGIGLIQPTGTFIHQNLLGMISHFVIFPFLAMLLTGPRIWLPAAVVLAAILADILTASRGTVATGLLGCGVVFMLSASRYWTSRKGLFLAFGALALIVASPIAYWSLADRFAAQTFSSTYDERAAFEKAAAMILADHPAGVGVNHYVFVANTGGYNRWAGVAPTAPSELAQVHNVYWLVAAESGYFGLTAFLLLLLRPLVVALRCGWRHRRDPRGDLLIGLGVGLSMVYLQSLWEWIFVDFQVQYVFALTVGMVASLADQLGYFTTARTTLINRLPLLSGRTRSHTLSLRARRLRSKFLAAQPLA